MIVNGYAIRVGHKLFYYTDGHFSYYEPAMGGTRSGTFQYTASDAMKALDYAREDGYSHAQICKVHITLVDVNDSEVREEYEKKLVEDIKNKLTESELRFLKEQFTNGDA